MSIIYEALKKIEMQKPLAAGKGRQEPKVMLSPGPDADKAPTLTRLVSVKPQPKNFSLSIAVAACIFLLLAVSVVLLTKAQVKAANPTLKGGAAKPSPAGSPAGLPAGAAAKPATNVVSLPQPAAAAVPSPKQAAVKPQDLVLEGIVYDEKLPLAIINGAVYRHYERLGDYMVIDITQKEVTLRNLNDDGLLHLALPF